MTDDREHHRRSTRLKGYDYTSAGGYFITVVAFRRECLFGEVLDGQVCLNSLGEIVKNCWEEIPSHFQNVDIDEFVVMPNHVHGIVFIHPMNNGAPFQHVVGATHASPLQNNRHASSLPNNQHTWSTYYDQHASPSSFDPNAPASPPRGPVPQSLGAIVGSFKSAVSRRAGRELNSSNLWQRNYYEHILRDQSDYERIAGYIHANPGNWGIDDEYR